MPGLSWLPASLASAVAAARLAARGTRMDRTTRVAQARMAFVLFFDGDFRVSLPSKPKYLKEERYGKIMEWLDCVGFKHVLHLKKAFSRLGLHHSGPVRIVAGQFRATPATCHQGVGVGLHSPGVQPVGYIRYMVSDNKHRAPPCESTCVLKCKW